jgi:predicted HicB family RNase H-like nuclease
MRKSRTATIYISEELHKRAKSTACLRASSLSSFIERAILLALGEGFPEIPRKYHLGGKTKTILIAPNIHRDAKVAASKRRLSLRAFIETAVMELVKEWNESSYPAWARPSSKTGSSTK